MRLCSILICLIIVWLAGPGRSMAEQVLEAFRVVEAPRVDGAGDDPAWRSARAIRTHDRIAGIDVEIKCVYTDTMIYTLVQFPDPDESRLHKPWIWNQQKSQYEMGPQREDCLVFKWALEDGITDLSLNSEVPHSSDVWFWKACRTDPNGYADDKIDTLGLSWVKNSQKVTTRSGRVFYLQRRGDQGAEAYRSVIRLDYEGDLVNQFEPQMPSASRADIRAKGVWHNGTWTIEFARSLVTGHADDVQFDTAKRYVFGVSRYEIAGRDPDPQQDQPLYGSGDVSEVLYLVFNRKQGPSR